MNGVIRTLAALFHTVRMTAAVARNQGLGVGQVRLAYRHLAGSRPDGRSDELHLAEAMGWLGRAQDVCGGNGVAAVYDLRTGWQPAYPETSGYVMATFLAYAALTGIQSFFERAVQIGDWEVAIQTPGGGILSHPARSATRVFNTGQVILGWCALYEATHNSVYLDAARRAGTYLIRLQEPDGSWVKDTYCGARTYHARVDWSLLRLAALTGEECYAAAAGKNICWVLQQQRSSGWFDRCGFEASDPITHVIVYTLRGLLESHLSGAAVSREQAILPAVTRAADALCAVLPALPIRGIPWLVPTSFDENWGSRDRDSCLTGNAQLACFLFRLSHATGKPEYRRIAENVLAATLRTHIIDTTILPVRGALAGSYPIYRGYHPLSYPNWATKFLADALMMKRGFDRQLAILA